MKVRPDRLPLRSADTALRLARFFGTPWRSGLTCSRVATEGGLRDPLQEICSLAAATRDGLKSFSHDQISRSGDPRAEDGQPGRRADRRLFASSVLTRLGHNLVRSWMQELSGRSIRVNAVSPGPTQTPGLAGLAGHHDVDDFFAEMAAHMPGARNIKPEEVAAAVTFLASDASGINGFDLQVDSGLAQI